jgi:ABC-type glutathione transport system ATPase component
MPSQTLVDWVKLEPASNISGRRRRSKSMDLVHRANGTSPAVELHQGSKVFRPESADVKVIDNISLTVPAGQSVAVMGASGSGKGALLHLIGGLSRVRADEIRVGGQAIIAMDNDTLVHFRRVAEFEAVRREQRIARGLET